MAYTPELSPRYSGILRRIAWAYEVPMTQAIEDILEFAGNCMDVGRICDACKDRSFCRDCLFAAHTEEKGEQAKDDGLVERKDVISALDEEKHIYLIGNPSHPLGFMVASTDDPLGYEDPAEALSVLETMREDFGNHLKLYRAIPVESPVATRHELEKYRNENGLEEHCPSLVDEYLL